MKKTLWLLPFLLTVSLSAVTPYFWEVRNYDDFRRGKLSNLSLTSDNQLILAPRYDLAFNTEQPLIWSAVTDSKGNVYLGTGHDGKIFKVDSSGKGELFADLMELDVFALAVDSKDVLYAGTSPNGKVYKFETASAPQTFFNPDAKYIWSLAFDKQNRLLVATGDKGIIYRVNPDGKGEPFYDTDETNVVSMVVDRDGNLIAGGDPKGYIYRISPDGKAFVLYDSGMREVHAVTIAPNGTIYAAVLSGQAVFPGPAGSGGQRPSSGADTTISVTIEAAAQNVDIVEPLGAASADGPRVVSSGSVGGGSAQSVILEILPDGTVNTIWRSREEMVYALLPRADKLLFSTGAKGRIYSLDRARNTTLLLESTEEQTTRLIDIGKKVYAASANTGKLFSMADALATSGTYESTVRDTDAISALGKIALKARQPALIQIYTRTGNTSAPDKTWSDWALVDASGATASPKARFVQWKAMLKASGEQSPSAEQSPALTSVTVPYLQQNFRPEVTSIDVLPTGVALVKVPSNSGAVAINDQAAARSNARLGLPAVRIPPRRVSQKGAQSFQWTATDKNQDILRYDLYYRGDSEREWKSLGKGVEDTFYTVDSDTLPDGPYLVRIVASDLPSNPEGGALNGEKETRVFLIDNTPPTVVLKQESMEGRRVRIAIDAVDSTSTLNQAEISTDTEEWRTMFPKDGIIDSKSESFTYFSEPLSPGEHVIAFRIYDQNDNVGMGKLVVRIP